MQDVVDRGVQQVAIMADDEDRVGVAREVVVKPERALQIEVVGGLVEQQQVRLGEEHGGERDAHAPAARERRARPLLRLRVEAEAVQDGGGPRRGGVRADVGEPRFDLGPAQAVGPLGFGEKRGALRVGREHHVDEALRTSRGFLGHRADAGEAGQAHCAALRGDLAQDDAEQRRLARAVAAHQPHPRAIRDCEGGAVEQQAVTDPVGEVVDVGHGWVGLLHVADTYAQAARCAPLPYMERAP
jgi:hypothetical protein